jgi:hypothetical protein
MGLLHSASQTNMLMEGSGTGHCEVMISEMTWYQHSRQDWVRPPVKISPPPRKGGPAINLYTISERLTLRCRTWALSEKVNLYNRPIKIPPRRPKHEQHSRARGSLPDGQAPVICTGCRPTPRSGLGTKPVTNVLRSLRTLSRNRLCHIRLSLPLHRVNLSSELT